MPPKVRWKFHANCIKFQVWKTPLCVVSVCAFLLFFCELSAYKNIILMAFKPFAILFVNIRFWIRMKWISLWLKYRLIVDWFRPDSYSTFTADTKEFPKNTKLYRPRHHIYTPRIVPNSPICCRNVFANMETFSPIFILLSFSLGKSNKKTDNE